MRTSLVADALSMAHSRGLTAGNAIMHTDRGGQYFAKTYQRLLKRLDIRQSTSRTGSCLDGAAAESFFATIKTEIGAESWPNRASARRDIERYITDYNARRLHSAINYQAPITIRQAWQTRMSNAT
jgi:putative transposase